MSETRQNYVFGPFNQENYNLPKWKYIKDKIYQLNATNEDETLPDLKDHLQLLLEINSAPNIDEYFGDPNIKNFFLNDFLHQNAKNIIATKTFNKPALLEICNRILEEIVFFWVRTLKEDNSKVAETAKIILDPSRSYFKMNNQEESSHSHISSFLIKPTQEHVNWVQSLKEGDIIDCIKHDQHYRKCCWSLARIATVMDSHVKVQFLYERETCNRYLEKTSQAHEIAPQGTKCTDFDWRLAIKVGDVIDACDTTNIWYNSTVMNERETMIDEEKTIREIYIGYRTYCEDGEKIDMQGRRFNGWSSKYDEWLTIGSPRIAQKDSMAKKFYMASTNNHDEFQVDDSNDKVISIPNKTIYAITRSQYSSSIFLVELLNKIGERGIFDKILERIEDPVNWVPIETLSIYCSFLGNIYALLHRDFAMTFVPKFQQAVWKAVLKSPENNVRNFTKDRIDAIIDGFKGLLLRAFSVPEKNEFLEMFQLEVCSICFESNFLERKLQGLKTLLDVIKSIRYGHVKFLNLEQLNKFITSHQIFDKIYGSKGHRELVQRSSDFLKFMITDSQLEINDLALVWNCTTKTDTESRLGTIKVLTDVAIHFKQDHLEFLMKKLSEISPSEIINEEIELLYEMSRFSLRSSGFTKKARDFFWGLITGVSNGYTAEIVELALTKFCDIMKNWELREERMTVLYNCVDNIEQHLSVLSSIKILKRLLEQYPSSPATSEKYTKSNAIEHLCDEKHLLQRVTEDLNYFKAQIRAKVADLKEYNEKTLDNLVGEKATYITHISERLGFVYYMLSTCDTGEIALNFKLLSLLWDAIVTDALIPTERDVVYKWIKETAESKSGFPMSTKDLLQFFQEKMNGQKDWKNMTLEGFNCFKNVFLVINDKLQHITKLEAVGGNGVVSYSYVAGGTIYQSYSYNHDEPKAQSDFEYKVNVPPHQLEGIQSIWNFIMIAENETVVEKAIDFINKLYIHVGASLEGKIVELRGEYLATCIKHLKELLESRNSLTESAFIAGCLRCLFLIRSIMDESEKKGVGNLKSHSGLVKGEILSFNVNNDLTSGSDVPKKVELRLPSNCTVYELRKEVGKAFKATWDQVKLTRNSTQKEIRDNENGRTIGDIRIRNGETLAASKRATTSIPQVSLVNSDGSINPLANKIFVDWFTQFSDNGKMSPDHCAAFIHSCTNDYCKGDDKRVKEVFANNDNDKDGFLTLENFLDFYHSAARQRASVVWSNLYAHHYRNDLRKANEVEDEKIEVNILARYIISTNDEYFKLMFSLLDFGGKIAIDAWKLINRLPTSPQLFADIVELRGIRDSSDKNWDKILDMNSNYRLLYALHVIEYLMEDEGEEEGDDSTSHFLWADPNLAAFKKTWRADFIVYGGFDHLFKIFNQFALKDPATFTIFDKNILSFILKILKDYLTATFASSVPNLYRNLSFIRLFHLSLDFINDYLKSSELGFVKPVAREQSIEIKDNKDSNKAQQKSVKFEGDMDIEDTKLSKKDSKVDGAKKDEEKKKENVKIEETEEFKVLVERLKGELGNHIISTINLKNFLGLITTLGNFILNMNGDLESEDRTILEHSLSILVAILLYDKKYITYFLNPSKDKSNLQESDRYILEGVFCSKAINVRKYFSHAVYILCKNAADFSECNPAKHLIGLFLRNLPSSEDENRKDCNQYFELLCKLIEETYAGKEKQDDSLNFEDLIALTIKQMRNHVSIEQRNNLHITDKIYIGLLQLCEKILNVKPHLREIVGSSENLNLIEEIFCSSLFDIQQRENSFKDVIGANDPNTFGKDYIKCKSKESRTIAYKLLNTLCKDNPTNCNVLMRCLHQLVVNLSVNMRSLSGFNYSPAGDTKSFYGYVGLKNLGCICYMNAMLQQFFMTPSFRFGILMADDKVEPKLVNKDNKFMIDDNVLHQLQQMFGFLELSDRQDYNPHEFCFSFKDHAGNPVNVSVQQDTQEFLNMIFDKLENGLKHTPFKSITDSIYGGKTSGQMICQTCGNLIERVESFYNLSVEVKNLKTIYESFDKFITGENIEDYFCEVCKKKSIINKRTCVAELPNVLIVHLQRIIFDLDSLMNVKINSRLEFPFDLNLEPYTKEGLEWRDAQKKAEKAKAEGKGEDGAQVDGEPQDFGPFKLHQKEYYDYKLAGVVVHVGGAEAGHYYSYINTNRGDPSKKDSSKPDKWLEFNDSMIRDFDVKNIENECFGGNTGESNDDAWGWAKAGRENSKNAYILVYEKVVKDPLKLVIHKPEDETYLNRILEVDQVVAKNPDAVKKVQEIIGEKETVNTLRVDYHMIKKFVPANIYKKVWEDNHKFMFERHIYNEDFFKFIKDVCQTIKLPEVPKDAGVVVPQDQSLAGDARESIKRLSGILGYLVFYLLARAHDNSNIGEIATTMKTMMSLVPEAAEDIFQNFVVKDLKNFLELFLTCPDKHVRYYCSQIALHAINVIITHRGFELNPQKLAEKANQLASIEENEKVRVQLEESVIRTLTLLIGFMSNEVAKNWTKFAQYFEFWRDFASSGEAQTSFLYSCEFIAVLIDFYLEKKSPLINFSEKKHTIGNRYTDPEFNPLIQTIALLVRRSRVQGQRTGAHPPTSLAHQGYTLFELSRNDSECLFCTEFYDKTMREKYDPQAFGIIIQHFSFENDGFSGSVAQLVLKGINRSNYDEAKPYLECMTYLLSINDSLQMKRIESVFGFPVPQVTSTRAGYDSYGMYATSAIDDQVINYEVPNGGEGIISLINIMFQNRRRQENLVVSILKQVLLLAEVNPIVLEYLYSLPPPSYNYAKFSDWMMPFLEYALSEAKRYYYTSTSKEEACTETMKLFKGIEEKIEKKIEEQKSALKKMFEKEEQKVEISIEEKKEDDTAKTLSTFLPAYVIGKTYREVEIDKRLLWEGNGGKIQLLTHELSCFITESKPNGQTNFCIPQSVMSDGRFKKTEVPSNSPLSFFIQPASYYKQENVYDFDLSDTKTLEKLSTAIDQESVPDGEKKKEPQKKVTETKEGYIVTMNAPSTEDFNLNFELNPVIRRFMIDNDSQFNLSVQFFIHAKSNDFMNFRIPVSGFQTQCRMKSRLSLMTIFKIFPEMDWGDYDFHCEIQMLDNNMGNDKQDFDSGKKKYPTFQIRQIAADDYAEIFQDNSAKANEEDFASYYSSQQ